MRQPTTSETATEAVDLVIAGAGPAGLSTALHLTQKDASWSDRLVVLEKGVHPRHKPCAGGITAGGLEILRSLGVELGTRAAPVGELGFVFGRSRGRMPAEPPLRVVCREAFDAALCRQAVERGVRVAQGEPILHLEKTESGFDVVTNRRRWRARAIVAADGSNSTIRRELVRLGWLPRQSDQPPARLLEVRRLASGEEVEFGQRLALFDFTPAGTDGLQGYAWSFPSWVGGRPVLNSGVFDSRAAAERPPARLRRTLERFLSPSGAQLEELELVGFPLHGFDAAAPLAGPGFVLAGDAAGADPLLGEGIAFALAYGAVAAAAVDEASRLDDWRFEGYARAVAAHPLLAQLAHRARWARRLYRLKKRWQLRLVWGAFRLYLSLRHSRRAGPAG